MCVCTSPHARARLARAPASAKSKASACAPRGPTEDVYVAPKWGATYHAHPVSMACGYAVLKEMVQQDLVQNAHTLESVMVQEMQAITLQVERKEDACKRLEACWQEAKDRSISLGEVVAAREAEIQALNAKLTEQQLVYDLLFAEQVV